MHEKSQVKVVIYSDYICPFCFIANELVKRIRKNFDLNVIWKPFELHPVGSWIPDMNSDYIKMAIMYVQRLANEYKIDIKMPIAVCNSRKSLQTAEFAREHGKFDEAHELLFKAYFLESKNIEKEKVLLDIIQKVGLDPEELKDAWEDGRYLKEIKDSIEVLHDLGITGVPTFFIGSKNPRIIIGAYPQEKIEKVIRLAQAEN